MPSTFFGLNIAYTGLSTYNAAINTTGNNITNVSTKGYTRQQVVQQAAMALRTNTSYGMAGAGVDATAIEQIRNTYYDLKYWNNNSSLGEYSTKAYYMKQIENYFADTETMNGFNSIYTQDFFAQMEELKKNAGDSTVRSDFISAARTLSEYFNTMSENMTQIQEDANTEIKDKVEEINSIASQISTLNKQINTIEINGIKANELRDQRNLLVDELSAIVDVDISETPIYNSNDPDNPTGANRYVVNIGGGRSLVDGNEYNTMECVARGTENKVNQSDAEGLYDITWKEDGSKYEAYGRSLSGELKALIEIRDGNNEEYFNGTISAKSPRDPAVPGSKTTVTIDTTADYLDDVSKITLNGSGTIKLGNAEYQFEAWDYNEATGEYIFTLTDSADVTSVGVGQEASVGKAIDYQGVPYYMAQMNEWVRNFSKAFNSVVSTGVDSYGNAGEEFFVAENITNLDAPYKFDQAADVSSTSDSYYQLTAATFSVSKDIINDVGKIVTTTTNGSTDKDAADIVDKLMGLKTDKNMMDFRGCTSAEFLQCILSDVALNASSANTFEENFQNISGSIQNQRLSISGVDNDEEALNLVKYQNAYNLSAQMIQVMSEMYDQLILSTGV